MTESEHLLTILAEECAEVSQRVSKALRFGLAEIEPGQELSNAERIRREYGDLIAAFEMIGINQPDQSDINDKKYKVQSFLAYSKDRGTLTS